MSVEEGRFIELLNPVSVRLAGVLLDLEVGALACEAVLVCDECGAEHEEQTIEETVDDLETTRLAAEGGGKVTLVAGLALEGVVLEADVGGLEDVEGEAVGLVLADGLEEAWEEGSAYDLVLEGFGVGEADGGGAVVFAIEEIEVLVVGAEDERHDFTPSCDGGLVTNEIAEFVDHEGSAYSGAPVWFCPREVVVAPAYGEILHDVALVEDIGPGDGHGDLEQVAVLGGRLGHVRHLAEELAQALGGLGEAGAAVEVVDLDVGDAGLEAGGDSGEVVVFRYDLDGLDCEGLGGVGGEHGDHHVGDDLEFRQVRGRDLDEDVGGVECDLGMVAVDDGW